MEIPFEHPTIGGTKVRFHGEDPQCGDQCFWGAAPSRQAIEEFQRSLSPDARLRKLVLDGRCDLCPNQN